MTFPIDHETCSRLLRAYAVGEAGVDAGAVTDHLEGCRQCTDEFAAVKRLLDPAEPLTEAERSQLRAAVTKATRPEPSLGPAPVAREPRSVESREGSASARARMRWLMPALSAAAAVIVIAGGIAFFGNSTSEQNMVTSADRAITGAARAPENTTPAAGAKSQPGPHFERGLLSSITEVRQTARPVLVALGRAYKPADGRTLASPVLDRLAGQAPPGLGRQILDCGGRLMSSAGSRVLLPAFGAQTSANGRRSLVLVFASSIANQGGLLRFEIDAWPVGSCTADAAQSSGVIRPQ
jgi:hypothetical protein